MHDLSHGHGHTAYLGVTARSILESRAEAVIKASLMPFVGQQGLYGFGLLALVELS